MKQTINIILTEFNEHGRLLETLRKLRRVIEQYRFYDYAGELEEIERNYHLMLDFMKRGYADTQRDAFYHDLEERIYHLIQNLILEQKKNDLPSYCDAHRRIVACNFDASHDAVRTALENYVADMAMLSLEPESSRTEHQHCLLLVHDTYMSRLFDAILLSAQWSSADATFYQSLITSPAIDLMDAQWLVSAIALACVNVFDINKLRMLAALYTSTADNRLRQRAFVGWALSLDGSQKFMIEAQKATIQSVEEHDGGLEQIKELQIQLLTSVNALHDEECIKRDIMPTLMKQGTMDLAQLKKDMTKPTDIEDILHPEKSEKAMGDVEDAMAKMQAMASHGKDIYYGGFSQTKRFAFFTQLSHWFEPFTMDHPTFKFDKVGVENARGIIENMLSTIRLCDSDNYSFVILFSKMLSQLPEQLRQVMSENNVSLLAASESGLSPSAVLRRNYLQDLFRFHQLYQMKDDFVDVFSMRGFSDRVNVFVADAQLFSNGKAYEQLCYDALRFLNSIDNVADEHYSATILPLLRYIPCDKGIYNRLFVADYLSHHGQEQEAFGLYAALVNEYPDNEKVLRSAAPIFLKNGKNELALRCYDALVEMNEANPDYQYHRAYSLIELKRYDEALLILHKLYYDNPDDANVARLRCRALLYSRQYDKAESEYRKLFDAHEHSPSDAVCLGISLWLLERVAEAVDVFAGYLRQRSACHPDDEVSIYDSLLMQKSYWDMGGKTDMDIKMMADLVDSTFGSN